MFFGTFAQDTKEKTYNYCAFCNICLGDQAQETKDEFRETAEKEANTNLNPYIIQRKNPYQLKLFGELIHIILYKYYIIFYAIIPQTTLADRGSYVV